MRRTKTMKTLLPDHKSSNDEDDSDDSIEDEQHQQMLLLKDGGDTTTALAMDCYWQHSFNNYNLDASTTGTSTTTARGGEDDYPPRPSFHGPLTATTSQTDLVFIPIVIRINVVTQRRTAQKRRRRKNAIVPLSCFPMALPFLKSFPFRFLSIT